MPVKQKSYRDKVNDGKRLVNLWIDSDKYEQIQRAAESVQEPVTTWIRRAVFTALRKWVIPESKALYEPCSICGMRHDKQEHYRND